MSRHLAVLILLAGCGRAAAPTPADAALDDARAGLPAVMKFCNPVYGTGSKVISLTFAVGDPPVAFSASSGTCTPAVPTPCKVVPTGARVPGRLLDSGGQTLTTGTLSLEHGVEYLVYTVVAPGGQAVDLTATTFPSGTMCDSTDPLARDGGMPDATTD